MDMKGYLDDRKKRADALKAQRQGMGQRLQMTISQIDQLQHQRDTLMHELSAMNGRIDEIETEVRAIEEADSITEPTVDDQTKTKDAGGK